MSTSGAGWSGLLHLKHDSAHKLHRDGVTSVKLSADGSSTYSVSQVRGSHAQPSADITAGRHAESLFNH